MITACLLSLVLAADPATTAGPAPPLAVLPIQNPSAQNPIPQNPSARAEDAQPPAGVAVVCPPAWRQVLQPWLDHRRRQGYQLYLVSPDASAERLREGLIELARRRPLGHVVLVGDAEPAGDGASTGGSNPRGVPPHYVRAKVNVRFGSEPEIATDNPYADLDGDGIPELAVGRLSVDTPDQLGQLVERILRYETSAASGDWRRRVNLVAGVGGFGPLADPVIEMATKKFLTDGIPPAYSVNMTYGSWRSPFCPDPRRFRQATLDRFNEGCLFWVYLGHGQRRYLDHVRVPGGAFPIFDVDDTERLRVLEGAPIAILLACYTGAYDEARECLAEEMLRAAAGPVAVLSGSRVTMPYAMAVMGNALMDEYFRQRRPTLGEIVLHTKRRLVREVEGDVRDEQLDSVAANRVLLDTLARALSPAANMLDEERREHVGLFNLLGDPLLRMPHAEPMPLAAAEEVLAGERLELTGTAPLAGRGVLELVCRRDRTRIRAGTRSTFEATREALAEYDAVYQQANDRRWLALPVELEGGPFRVEVPVPAEARGPCYVRIAMQQDRRYALGATQVYVRRQAAPDVTVGGGE